MQLIHPLRKTATALVAVMTATAAAQLPAERAQTEELLSERRVNYSCHGEFDFREVTALFFNQTAAEVILLFSGDARYGAVRLPQQRSASGARYSDGRETFWVKGDTATYMRGGSYQCKVSTAPQ